VAAHQFPIVLGMLLAPRIPIRFVLPALLVILDQIVQVCGKNFALFTVSACTAIPACDNVTCTSSTDTQCLTCSSGYYLVRDSGTCQGIKSSFLGTESQGCDIPHNCLRSICTNAWDSSCSDCALGFILSYGECSMMHCSRYNLSPARHSPCDIATRSTNFRRLQVW
jgi:hypothetical protein